MDKLDLKGITLEELRRFIENLGEPRFRAAQVFDWLYSERISHRINSIQEMSNLGKACIDKLSSLVYITSLTYHDSLSKDKVNKYIFKTEDDNLIPTVLVDDRLILSTQIGCSYNCKFCASGKRGLVRDLTAGEIIDQVVKVQNQMGSSRTFPKIELAGMGEPLANYNAVVKAVDIMRSKSGLNFYLKNITLSTCGIAPQIKALVESGLDLDLIISLHSVQNSIRSAIMPVNKKYSVESVLDAVKYYTKMTGREVILDYILIEGINDSLADAKGLVNVLRGIPVKLRISSYNTVLRAGLNCSRLSWHEQFVKILYAGNIVAELTDPFGIDLRAGYGQLKPEIRKQELIEK